ncbi:hypothetical protein UlMin_026117 [Ulmus minor]
MELPMLVVRIIVTLGFVGFIKILVKICNSLILKPLLLSSKLRKQGIRGPPASILLGNSRDLKDQPEVLPNSPPQGDQPIIHSYSSSIFPSFTRWTKQYGPTFMFSLGNMQCLHMNDAEVVKEMSICTSLDFGKPLYQQKMLGPLLGQGVLTSNGVSWSHQRKIVAREFSIDKVKGMTNLIVECATTVVNSWTNLIEKEAGGAADIKLENHLSRFSGDAISRACFGSNYSKGEEIFSKLRELEEQMSKRSQYYGIPIMRYLPTKSNRETQRLEKEIRELIMKVVKERKETTSREKQSDLLEMLLEGARNNSDLNQDTIDHFIVDNCKNIYLAGYETTSLSAGWALMLLASNPEWQHRAREEVMQICGGQLPDPDMLRKMKVLTMVINETLRLYPTSPIFSREALKDLKFGNINVPKGVIMWTSVIALHQDPEIWGPDVHLFNPQRFENGVRGSCKFPHSYQPFGVGPRVCLGQHFAVAELKILLSLILSKFTFSLSPSYKHSPIKKLIIRPEYGVNLLVRKL